MSFTSGYHGGINNRFKNRPKRDFDMSRFEKKMEKVSKGLKISRDVVLKEMGKMFTQSVIKATPQTKLKRRRIIGVKGRVSIQERWKVTKIVNSKFKWVKWFKSKSAAQKYTDIYFKGVGKAGWLQSAIKAGNPSDGFKPTPQERQYMPYLGFYKEGHSAFKKFIIFRNQVLGISRFGQVAVNIALAKTAKRLNWWMKNEIKKRIKPVGMN